MWFVLIALDFELQPSKILFFSFLVATDDGWEYVEQMWSVSTFSFGIMCIFTNINRVLFKLNLLQNKINNFTMTGFPKIYMDLRGSY